MLLLDFIDYNVLASSLSDFVVNDCSWNRGEEEHVEKNEDNVEDIVWLVILHC